tara:strand:+ start:1993 stop:2133 length:141 start_codon:yes stop_codon:yes gene_type:complete
LVPYKKCKEILNRDREIKMTEEQVREAMAFILMLAKQSLDLLDTPE